MGKIKILADGKNERDKAQARGKLFEKMIGEVLRHYGYKINKTPSVNYAGMEIDIEGELIATGIPLCAECKYSEKQVDTPKLQAFIGKYITRWNKDKKCHGLFLAIPGINSHAKGFYNENWKNTPDYTVVLYEEEQVLEAILNTNNVVHPDCIMQQIIHEVGKAGDWILLYTESGLFFIQYVIPPGSAIAEKVAIFNSQGKAITSEKTIDYITNLFPEIKNSIVILDEYSKAQYLQIEQEKEEIVEVKGSTTCFEYQFPASPEHFVGRKLVLDEVKSFLKDIINKNTSSRGLLFQGNSGWGKSSTVLASTGLLKKSEHFAVAIDSRSASSSQFILRVIDYTRKKFDNFGGLISPDDITGFDGALDYLLKIGKILEEKEKVLFIFLDQFENIFFQIHTLKNIRNLFLKLCDAQTNVVIGFSWKTDLIGSTIDFPYQIQNDLVSSSKRVDLEIFSEVETNAILDKLSAELHTSIRKDLRFLLSEFSQGYPWLLKKLCAHVKAQRESGKSQANIAESFLNIEELFKEDIRYLSAEQDEALHQIAKIAPISVSEIGDEFSHTIVQSLVDRRLIVRIGNKYDVYWDIFRDYLNTGRLPVQENYMLRKNIGTILSVTKLLVDENGKLNINQIQEKLSLTEKTFYNIARDMRLLGLARSEEGFFMLNIDLPIEEKEFEIALKAYLKERLQRNRLIWGLIEKLKLDEKISITKVAELLSSWCPYITASVKTWRTYARVFSDWMDRTDLAIYDSNKSMLVHYTPGEVIRERQFLRIKGRSRYKFICVQYSPVEEALIRIANATKKNVSINWSGFTRSTKAKVLSTIEDLGLIRRESNRIFVTRMLIYISENSEKRPALLGIQALKIESFVKFFELLKKYKTTGRSLFDLGKELKSILEIDWKDTTAHANAKIMLNWARHTNLAPGVFAKRYFQVKQNQINIFNN